MKTTIAVGNRRLLKLAAFLRKLPRKRFNYESWVGEDWQGAPSLSCGTTACALGWATTMPIFRRLGLRLESIRDEDGFRNGYVSGPYLEVFALDSDDLFYPDAGESNWTPKQVAGKIERFVKNRQVA